MIRPARRADAPAIARVHVASWHETYPGLVPGWEIAARTYEDRLALWSGVLADPATETATFVAEADGAVAGFGMAGPQRTQALRDLCHSAEVWTLYVLRAVQGHGTGRALMDACWARWRIGVTARRRSGSSRPTPPRGSTNASAGSV